MTARNRWLILAFAVVGLGLASASTWVHYRVLTDPSYVSPCDINATFNCSQVYMSRFGSLGGVPVAIGGMIWFALVALVAGFANPHDEDSAAGGYLFAVATVGLAVVLYLGYASFFILKNACVLCIGTYVCVLAIFVLSALTSSVSMMRLPMRVVSDLRAALSRPAALFFTVLYLAGAATGVAFFPKEGVRAQAATPTVPPSADAQARFADAWSKQPRVDLGIAAAGAKVVVVKFNDYECPGCRSAEEWYKPIFEKFAKSSPGQVKYVMKDWAWNSSCNFNVPKTFPGHEASCDAAAAARMATERGKYQDMASWIWANQGTTPESVRQAATRILGITDFAREYALKLPEMKRDFADGGVLNVSTTPTYYINGVLLPTQQMMAPEYFEMAINIELKK